MARKATHQTDRQTIVRFDEIVNIGPAMTAVFFRMGMKKPQELVGKDPLKLYQRICRVDRKFYDPCVLDVLMATVDYMNDRQPKSWWKYSSMRKKTYTDSVDRLRVKYA